MIPTLTLFMAVVSGPGSEPTPSTATTDRAAQQDGETTFATLREARDAVSRALRDSNRARGRDPAETVPAVAAAYRKLQSSEKLPVIERRRLQAQLHTRLSELESVLQRREKRAASSGSGGVVANAQDLIDLIQTTIAPDTWDINGGNGTIFYFPNR